MVKKTDRNVMYRAKQQDIDRERKLRTLCRQYNPQPIISMTDMEALEFAIRQANDAMRQMRVKEGEGMRRMNMDEVSDYAAAIKASILYFNNRAAAHKRILQYRDECRKQEDEQRRNRAESRKHTPEIYIHAHPW